ncbi:MAG: DNA primase, partial [Candidatus Bathyarchaeum sp.]
ELQQVTTIKYVARAPRGKEVEDLTFKEIEKALKEKVPLEKVKGKRRKEQPQLQPQPQLQKAPKPQQPQQRRKKLVPKQIVESAKELNGTLEAVLLNKDMKQVERMPVRELAAKLQQLTDIDTVVFDGVITQRLVDIAAERNVNYLVAARISKAMKQPLKVKLMTFEEILE